MNKPTLNSMLEDLYPVLNSKGNEISQTLLNFFKEKESVIVFLSATDGNERAYVVNGRGTTVEEAWKKAAQEIRKTLFLKKIKPLWVKADLITSVSSLSLTDFMNQIANTKKNYFREGISFDSNFQNAFLEQEVNANVFFHNWKDGHADLAIENINNYIKNYRNSRFRVIEEKLKEKGIYTFQTISAFHDGQEVHEQYNGGLNNGCRVVDEIDSNFIYDIVDKSSCFLKEQVYENGYFRYGYFPAFNKEINTYNILRHASTTYSMAEAFELTKNEELLVAIERSLEYLVKEAIAVHTIDGRECAFVLEKVADNEIKLGANGHAILAMSKYTKVTGDETYLPMLEKLANGILQFQKEDGSFVHILNEDLTIKDEFRTIYYDGEAAFALMRLYDIDKNERWLKAVEKGFEYFVANDYWKYGDHWMSYASNELFQYRPERKYAELNLRNAARRLDFCLTRETAYPTLLELLMASYNLISYMKENNLHLDLLDDFDEEKLNRAIQHRVKHQLNSYFWPEMAMYFKVPNNIVNSFYIRHHSYRVRIDDVEHNLSGYCSYYHNVLMRESDFEPYLTEPKLEKREASTVKLQKETHTNVVESISSRKFTRPLIGMLRQFKRPNKLVRVAAIEAEKLNCDFIFFHPEDVDFKNQTINGQVYKDGRWEIQTSRFPDVIENSPSRKVYRKIYEKLEHYAPITMRRIGNKNIIAKRLSEQRMFADMVIPYEEVINVQQVMDYLNKYKQIIIKPSGGNRGRGVHFLMEYEDGYLLHYNNESYKVNYVELIDQLNTIIKTQMIVQPFITSITKEGRPFDIRIHIRRNGEGQWQKVKIYPRLGEIGNIVSNVSQGGYIGNLEEVLEGNFGKEKASSLKAELNAFATLFPEKFQLDYEHPIDALGIDIGIDMNGKLWIFEVNSFPGSTGFEEESQPVAIAYAKYLATQQQKFTEENAPVKKDSKDHIVIAMLSPAAGTSKLKAHCADADFFYKETQHKAISYAKNLIPKHGGDFKTDTLTLAMIAKTHSENQYRYMLASIAQVNNVDFYIFTPEDIDYKNKVIRGKKLKGGKWITEECIYPDYIYDNLHYRGHKKYECVYHEFSHIPFNKVRKSYNSNKRVNYNIMAQNSYLKKFLIPYEIARDVNFILDYIDKNKEIIIKNIQGAGGSSVASINKLKENEYEMIKGIVKEKLNLIELKKTLDIRISASKGLIIQPFINAKTLTGNPYDIRVHIMRGRDGEFKVAKLLPRIGSSLGIISNIAEGGSTCDINMFLKKHINYTGVPLKEIKSKMLEFAKQFQEDYPTTLDWLGLDLVIDNKGNMFVFEVNINRFSPASIQFESAYHIISYGIFKALQERK